MALSWQCNQNNVLMPLLLLMVSSQSHSQTLLWLEPPGSRDLLTREGLVVKLSCFYDTCGTYYIQYGDSHANILRLWQNTTVTGLNVDAVPHIINNTVKFQFEFTANRSHNNNTITCGLEQLSGVSTDVVRLNVKYPPSPNFTTIQVPCANSSDTDPTLVVLVFTDTIAHLGNPVSNISWETVSGTVSGVYNQQLSLNVTRKDNREEIIARAHNGIGSATKKFILCVESKPSPPSQLICTRLVAGYNCSWGYPDDDGGYPVTHYIYSHSATSSSPGHWVTVQASVTTALNRMLEENTSYMISVVAVNAVGDSDPTTTVILTPKRPDRPEITGAFEISVNSVTVSWDPPPNADPDPQFAVLEYRVGLHVKEQFTWEESLKTVTTSSLSQTISGLNSSTIYWIRVGARNSVGWGDLSVAVFTITKDLGNVGQPAIESIRSTTCESISLNWTKANPGGRSYKVLDYLVVVYQASREVARENVTNTGTTVDGLEGKTEYDVEVTARNRKAYGHPSPLANVTTLMCPLDSSNTGLSDTVIGAIAGGGVGAVVIVLLVLCACVIYCKKDSSKPVKV